MRYLFLLIPLIFNGEIFSQKKDPGDFFNDFSILNISSQNIHSKAIRSSGKPFTLQVGNWVLNLRESELLTSDYKSLDHSGNIISQGQGLVIPMSGTTSGGGKAALSVGNNFLMGFIEDGSYTYFIEPLQYYKSEVLSEQYILYEKGNVKDTELKTCGLTDTEEVAEFRNRISQRSAGLCYEIEYGICNDYSMVAKYGSIENAEMHAIGIANNANTLYDDEFGDQVKLLISGQLSIGCQGCDPWSSTTDASQLLASFRDWARLNLEAPPYNIQHDIASLWTSRNFDGNVIGIAYIGGACLDEAKYNVLQDFDEDAVLKTILAVHEIGHNLNAYHDRSGSGYIMAPYITNTSEWSVASIQRIEYFYNHAACFSVCPGYTPQVDLARDIVNIAEASAPMSYNDCSIPYFEVTNSVELSHNPEDTVIIELKIDSLSTATCGVDFELTQDTFVFLPAGPITFDINLKIFNDHIEEDDEYLKLDVSIISGTVDPGTVMSTSYNILEVSDEVSDICCSPGTSITYGTPEYYFSGVFLGFAEDAKTRVLFTANQLLSYGLTPGYINNLSLYVQVKNSIGPYQNFRIGMKLVPDLELTNTWPNTSEVFFGDIHTFENTWNKFNFTDPFFWDGVSNLYVDFCYDNLTPIGKDYIVGFDPPTDNIELYGFRAQNSDTGCTLNTGSYFYYYDRQPWIQFGQVIGARVATALSSSASTYLQVGDIAHLYDAQNTIIGSIKNIGYTDLGCIDIEIVTAGIGKTNFTGLPYSFSDKTFSIQVENDSAYYELTLYFNSQEIQSWGTPFEQLKMLLSEGIISTSTFEDSEVQFAFAVEDGVGYGNNFQYTISNRGSIYASLTDAPITAKAIKIDDTDLIINGEGDGLFISNMLGANYYLSVDNSGVLTIDSIPENNISTIISDADLFIESSTRSLIARSDAGDYFKLLVDDNGNISTTPTSYPGNAVTLPLGNLMLSSPECGLILHDNIGQCWKLIIDEKGRLLCTRETCQY